MNEEKIRKMESDSFFENIMNNLDSSIIFKYIEGLEKENKQIRKAIDKIFDIINYEYDFYDDIAEMKNDIEFILKEVDKWYQKI